MTTFNEKLVTACQQGNVDAVKNLLVTDEEIVVQPEECYDSDSSSCGYCNHHCKPRNPMLKAIRVENVLIVDTILANPKFPLSWEDGCRYIIDAARLADATGDDVIFEKLMADPRLFPKDDPAEVT